MNRFAYSIALAIILLVLPVQIVVCQNPVIKEDGPGSSTPIVLTPLRITDNAGVDFNNTNIYGTFQFIVVDHVIERFTEDVLKIVEANRRPNKDVIFELSPHTQVRILSKKTINSSSFDPLEELYVFK